MTPMFTYAFIGCGNMAGAIVRGMMACEVCPPQDVMVYDVDAAKTQRVAEDTDVRCAASMEEAVASANIVFLAVKPQVCAAIMPALSQCVGEKIVVSIVAGWTTRRLEKGLPHEVRVIRTMPNTPLMVGQGMTALVRPQRVSEEEWQAVKRIFASLGQVMELEERFFDAVTAISGSGPAYVFLWLEAMADAGVQQGLPYDVALRLATQTVLGSAVMIAEGKGHPAQLRNNVCSPGGTTIDAIAVMEKAGVRSAMMEAVAAATLKSKMMGE